MAKATGIPRNKKTMKTIATSSILYSLLGYY
jgi:hypothetical protein